jgi:hypothetical protein
MGRGASLIASAPIASPLALAGSAALQVAGPPSTISAPRSGTGMNDPLGTHSLLDLMFLVVFESFDAVKV